jgi:pimeloyl-ACP methyl ester carboxylesterase
MWTAAAGTRVHARVGGAGSPIVLVHGLGVSSRYMVPLAVHLARIRRVYALDLPGFGLTPGPPGALDIPALAEALAAWMTAAGLHRAVLLGNSMGCQIAVDAAARHPELATHLVLVGPTTDPGARTVLGQLARTARNSVHERPSLSLVAARDYADCGLRRAAATFRHALRDPVERKLPLVHAPTLVVRGTVDPIVSQRWAQTVAATVPHGRLALVPGPHTLNYTQPLALARVVHAYLEETR